MALEFPSWLEWMGWLVGSAWPHGNEDLMWQMAHDLDSVAGQADDLLGDLDGLIGAIGNAYPNGDGGENILQWLTPLRDGDSSGHGSIREFGDNFRQLSTAADNMGDQLQSAKLNFYIAGAWLVGELAWAAATGPFAPESETAVINIARVTFHELGEAFSERVIGLIERCITNDVLKAVLPKLIYEIGKQAVIATAQSTAQELLVDTIQDASGHGHGYDWGAIGKNALVSAVSGGAGGMVGLGANHLFPTEMGGLRGSFNGMLTGGLSGLGGSGAAWLTGGLVNGDWQFDPRSLIGGAFMGAGASALHGYVGDSNHAGAPMGTRDGSAVTFHEPSVDGNPSVTTNSGGGNGDVTGRNGNVNDGNGNVNGGNGNVSGGNSDGAGQPGGPQLHPTSSTAADTAPPEAPGRDTSNQGNGPAPTDNGGVVTGGGRDRPDPNPQDVNGATDQTSSTTSGPGMSPVGDNYSGGHPDTPQDANPQAAGNVSHNGFDGPGEAGRVTPDGSLGGAAPMHGADSNAVAANDTRAPGADARTPGTDARVSPADTRIAGPDSRVSQADPARAASTPRDLRTAGPADGTAAKPAAADARAGGDRATRPGTAPLQSGRTGTEADAPTNGSADNAGLDALTSLAGIQEGLSGLDGLLTRDGLPGDGEGLPSPLEPQLGDRDARPGQHPQPDNTDGAPHDRQPDNIGAPTDPRDTQPGDRNGLASEYTEPADETHLPREQNGRSHSRTDDFGNPIDRPEVHPDLPRHDAQQHIEHDDAPAVVPIPMDTPHRAGLADPRAANNPRNYDVAAAGPVGEFRGDARVGDPLEMKFVLNQIKDYAGLITPEGVSWNRDEQHFVLDGGQVVRLEIGDTEHNNVAEFRPSADGYDIRISKGARDQDVMRALAHELAEIRLNQDDDILIDPHDDRPTEMSTQLGGRFAEMRALADSIDSAVMDPAQAPKLAGMRSDLRDLAAHLGFRDPEHAPIVERLLAEHDPVLARRLALEDERVFADRPTFNPDLTESDFRHGTENHLNQLRELVTGEHAEDLLRAEEQGLDGRMREELSRRLFDPIFLKEAKAARDQVPGLLDALNPINAAINHPALHGPERAAAIHRAIDDFHDWMPEAGRTAFGPDLLAHMHACADAFADAPERITGVIDHATGLMDIGGEHKTFADFLHDIDHANRGAAENALSVEYTVVLHDPVDGLSTVEVLPRPRPQHRLPIDQLVFGPDNQPLPHEQRPSVPAAAAGGHTIDVGVGRGAFGVEMTPAADRAGGGLIIKTELADGAPLGGQRRRDLGILDPGPLVEPGTVMVFGNLLDNGHLLNGDIARIYINNVSAHLPDSAYHPMAEAVSKILAPGGRVEIQWDMKPDEVGGKPDSRGHIRGDKLWGEVEKLYEGGHNPFQLADPEDFPHPGNRDYDYTIDAGSSNDRPYARMEKFSPPQPEHRWIMEFRPDSAGTPEHTAAETTNPPEHNTQHGAAAPIGDFQGNARPEDGPKLTPKFVLDQITDNLALIAPEDVSWNGNRERFLLPDNRSVTVTIGTTSDDHVAEFHARPDGSGYDVVLSARARDEDVTRALAHELAEIRLSQEPEILIDPFDDRPSEMSTHLGGRFAEMRVLTAHIDRATVDPARATELPRLRQDLHDLTERIGLHDPEHADTVRQLLSEHDPALARRFELEQQGLHEHRPTFGKHLTDAEFDRSSAEHLNQLQQLLNGDHVEDVVRTERMALDGRMREELSRRIFDPLFDPALKAARKTVDVEFMLDALDPVNRAINDPTLSGPERSQALHQAINRFRDDMPEKFQEAVGPHVFDQMRSAADTFARGLDNIAGVIDHATGELVVNGERTNLADFLRGVDRANRGAGENALNVEYTVAVHDAVDGRSAVEVLPRPRPQHRLPLERNAFGDDDHRIPHQPRPAAAVGGHTVDVGVGRSAFAVEMTPAADRAGDALIIKTELASLFPIKGQRRRDLGILDPGPLTEPGTVTVFGDLLTQGSMLSTGPDGTVGRIFINNVSADLPDSAYHEIAAKLATTLTPGGRIELQWDMKPERTDGIPGDRNHILGTKLWEALVSHYGESVNPFRVEEYTEFPYPGNENYIYTIDAGASNKLNTALMATYNPPVPDHRMVIVYEPHDSAAGHESPAEHGTASPVGEFHGEARPSPLVDLTREDVVDRVENELGLIRPEDVSWSNDERHFVLPDGRTVRIDVAPTEGRAVAEFHSTPDGYEIHVSPRARDQDVVRAVAHELAEIRLSQEPDVLVDPTDDRPNRMTSHLGGRFAEFRTLVAHIDEVVPDRNRAAELPELYRDLNDLIGHLGLHDPEHAPIVERLLAEHDPELARRIDQARTPDSGILRPGEFDSHAEPTAHDLGRIRQLRELAERADQTSPEARQHDLAARADHDSARREALGLVERLGLREDTPGAAERRALVADRLTEPARRQVDELLTDVGRRESDLPAPDRELVANVRLDARAADALDFLSLPFHKAVMKAHTAYRTEMTEHLARAAGGESGDTGTGRLRPLGDHMVEDTETGARWFRWPPGTEETPEHPSIPDVGIPADPDYRLPEEPRQLHDVWSGLSTEQKDAWHHADPFIGNRDGIPQADRDHYNRRTLDMLREQAEREQLSERLDVIRDMQKYLDAPPAQGVPEVYLSYLDEKLQYIYALGNPDHADYVAVELAGAFRRRSGVGYATETLQEVRMAALQIDPGAEVSAILFGAYDNPNSLVSALHSGHAEDGAAKVREYHDGLRVTREGPPAHLTTIAHSYGGVTGGHSAGHGHELNTDALVFIGSWGTGVTSVADLRLTGVDPADNGDHVFATMAAHDSIQLMPPTHGPAPAEPEFGATVFEAPTTPSDTRLGWNPADHVGKNYFNRHQETFRMLGLILTGNAHLLR
ncbi:alpha/beta hydrolase [Nocardia sp. NPDC088792]|uniref:alpha/beta hydrolase n=1 Tax=Nocardia sp. NPDC088792 TaxID=3364332 RepID=UPI00381C9E7A